jgi:hypothetical protein
MEILTIQINHDGIPFGSSFDIKRHLLKIFSTLKITGNKKGLGLHLALHYLVGRERLELSTHGLLYYFSFH